METNQLLSLSPVQLRRAAEIKDQIDQLNDELARILQVGGTEPSTSPKRAGGRRQMSAEGRRRIADAARARWAKARAAKGPTVANKAPAKGRRKMSAAARAKIAAAARARWAKVRAAKS